MCFKVFSRALLPGGELLGNLMVSFSSNEKKKKKEADVVAAVIGEAMGSENADLLTPMKNA